MFCPVIKKKPHCKIEISALRKQYYEQVRFPSTRGSKENLVLAEQEGLLTLYESFSTWPRPAVRMGRRHLCRVVWTVGNNSNNTDNNNIQIKQRSRACTLIIVTAVKVDRCDSYNNITFDTTWRMRTSKTLYFNVYNYIFNHNSQVGEI